MANDLHAQQVQDTVQIPLYDGEEIKLLNQDAGIIGGTYFLNCYPTKSVNPVGMYASTGFDAIVSRQGLSSIGTLTPTIESYMTGGLESNAVPLANMVMTQLYDVMVAAYFDTGASKIYIIQFRPVTRTTVKIGEIASANVNDTVFISEVVDTDSLTPSIVVTWQKSDKTASKCYYAHSSGGVFSATTLTQITHASFPDQLVSPKVVTGPAQQLNGTIYVGTIDGFIYGSTPTSSGNPDVTTWNTLTTVTATQYPDNLTGIYRYKSYLLAVGKDSIEFFVDAGNPTPASALIRTDGVSIKFGAVSPKLVCNVDDTLYWVAYSSSGTTGVWKLEGSTPQKISNPKLDYYINIGINTSSGYSSKMLLSCLWINNTKHLMLQNIVSYNFGYYSQSMGNYSNIDSADAIWLGGTAPNLTTWTGNIAMMDLDSGIWWWMQVLNSRDTQLYPASEFPSSLSASGHYTQYILERNDSIGQGVVSSCRPRVFTTSYGNVQKAYDDSPSAYSTPPDVAVAGENGPLLIYWQTPTYWFGTEKRKRIHKVRLRCDTPTQAATDTNQYSIYLAYDKNGKLTPTLNSASASNDVIQKKLGTWNNTNHRFYTTNLGMARSWTFVVWMMTEDPIRITGLEVDMQSGTG